MVAELVALVGSGNHAVKGERTKANRGIKSGIDNAQALATPAKKPQSSAATFHQTGEISPKHLIPLDENEFEDF